MFEDETQVAWNAMPRGAPLLAADQAEIGTAESVLGDEQEDIFHGIVAKLKEGARMVEVPAARVTRITDRRVITDLTLDDVAALPAYREKP
jgi:hypothetical protein